MIPNSEDTFVVVFQVCGEVEVSMTMTLLQQTVVVNQ